MTTTPSDLSFVEPLPESIYQTWVKGRVQDSSTPERVLLSLTGAAAEALMRASGRRVSSSRHAADEPGGELGRFFHVLLLRSDLRPVEAWDADADDYAPLRLPQNTFSFHRAAGGRVLMEAKRKHLPPSKNHGEVRFRLAVALRLPGGIPTASSSSSSSSSRGVGGAIVTAAVALSTPFRILSKQSLAAPRPEPKRKRNPAPTKPFVAPFDAADASVLAVVACSDADAAARSVVSSSSSCTSATAGSPGSLKRAHSRDAWDHDDDDDEAYEEEDEEDGGRMPPPPSKRSLARRHAPVASASAAFEAASAAAAASMPRPMPGAAFRFGDDDDDDDDTEELVPELFEDDDDDDASVAAVLAPIHPTALPSAAVAMALEHPPLVPAASVLRAHAHAAGCVLAVH